MMRRWFTRWLWLNWAVIVLLVLLTHLCGQRCWLVGLLVYTPPQMWLVFLAVIALAAWRMNRRLALLCIGTAVVFAGPLWEWRTHRPAISKDLWREVDYGKQEKTETAAVTSKQVQNRAKEAGDSGQACSEEKEK